MRRRLPDVSTTQLVASGVATLAAAIGASYLGVYGTIIGAAFMSVASTAGASVFKHYLDQGKEQIKERTHMQAAAEGREAAQGAASRATSADPTRSVAWPGEAPSHAPAAGRSAAGGDPNATRFDLPLPGGGDPNATRLDANGSNATRMDPNATHVERSPAAAVAAALAEDEAVDGAVRGEAWRAAFRNTAEWTRQHWVKLAVSSAAIFAIVIGGITIYEATTGAPIGRNHDTGTSVRNVFGGGGSQDRPKDTPSQTPTTEQTGPGETPSGTAPGTPSDGPSTPETGQPTDRPTDTPSTEPTTPSTEPSTPTEPAPPAPSGGTGTGQQPTGQQQGQPRTGTGDGS
ncbi:hypothetical protein [Actinomadura xylanilytica]|uniref:hypothetical protein n=1 Tax=Actinomadura xylanilytica TaxID=887459 RepID=UPI00255B0D49|nr:hypothetical protein [Actinomadura xylanilytica]MDL4775024.1 hypothetical protein [Actinomadura xylanilytica]